MKKVKLATLALMVTVSLGMPLASSQMVSAIDFGSVLGTVISGAQQYKELDDYIHYVNDTDEGRNEFYNELRKEKGVSDDGYHTAMLDDIMERLTNGIGDHDESVYDKPFLYFLNNDPNFNASCGLGHVMTVNKGLFSISDNIDEVAFVLGHEMGHGMKDHCVSGNKKRLRTVIGASVAASAMGNTTVADLAMSALVGQINNIAITKKQEWEADNLSFDYCYSAGYNPGAGAALWRRVNEKAGEFKNSLVGEIFSPNDHPSNQDRMLNYEKKLTALSKNHVTIKKNTDMVQINGKDFTTPAPLSDMSSAERKYFLMGNLAAAYDHGQDKEKAYNNNGTVYLGTQAILTPVAGDKSADELVKVLNQIK